MAASLFTYRAQIVEWIDGDTADLDIDLGFGVHLLERVRLAGINTPETRSRDAAEKARGKAAHQAAVKLAPPGATVVARTHKSGNEKYGRFLADIVLDCGASVAAELLKAGHGVKYDGGKR